MFDPTDDDYWDTPSNCLECGGMPAGHHPDWSHCPFHGTKLISNAEISGRHAESDADARRDAEPFDLVGATNNLLEGVAR